jgi:hypothetical protein
MSSTRTIPPAVTALAMVLFVLVLSNLLATRVITAQASSPTAKKCCSLRNTFPLQDLFLIVHAAVSVDVVEASRESQRRHTQNTPFLCEAALTAIAETLKMPTSGDKHGHTSPSSVVHGLVATSHVSADTIHDTYYYLCFQLMLYVCHPPSLLHVINRALGSLATEAALWIWCWRRPRSTPDVHTNGGMHRQPQRFHLADHHVPIGDQ